ncbi:MAG: hypothetical protein BWZ01_02342 [Deltaproteobacteria bacterium ADurb.BinA179]|jgi:hypothetical protein|nr:hypothetical protein [Deltaproteobacteria bacterium]MDI9543204.1 hypothetical protein [Pseudomonadota bacterium]OPZ25826.1 MAG: hypothetical protein BWZ01_02342 [Deltaproteobacteria bacterium ADurb.BinA179]HOD70936.1 hypothetical protein [Deltaproteobacteria bacterium]HOE72155.1 hypothetical protein [Deltaproteobacteria bacterium]
MIWICLFIPLCIWLGIVVISPLNIYTTGGIAITAFIYLLIELRQVSRDRNRSRLPLWVMFLMLASVVFGMVW